MPIWIVINNREPTIYITPYFYLYFFNHVPPRLLPLPALSGAPFPSGDGGVIGIPLLLEIFNPFTAGSHL